MPILRMPPSSAVDWHDVAMECEAFASADLMPMLLPSPRGPPDWDKIGRACEVFRDVVLMPLLSTPVPGHPKNSRNVVAWECDAFRIATVDCLGVQDDYVAPPAYSAANALALSFDRVK
jgi:hypothetical protein